MERYQRDAAYFALINEFTAHYKVSAKEDEGIEEAVKQAVKEVTKENGIFHDFNTLYACRY